MLAACGAAVLLALRLPSRKPPRAQPRNREQSSAAEPSQEILDSAGPAVVAVGLDRQLTYVNLPPSDCWAPMPAEL